MRWWLYPCPQGVSLTLPHSPENYHICPHFTSLSTSSLSHFKCFGFLHLLSVSFSYPLIFTSCKRKKPHKPMYLIRCAWHIMLHLNVQLSSPRFSFSKRSEVWAKSSQSRSPNPVKKVALGPVSSFPQITRGDAVGPTHHCGRNFAYPASILSSALGK